MPLAILTQPNNDRYDIGAHQPGASCSLPTSMQTLWSPPPVFVLFRRIVNAFSAFSVSQHYLLQRSPPPPEGSERKRTAEAYNVLRPFSWLGWVSREPAAFSLAAEAVPSMQEPLRDLPPPTYPRRTLRKRPSDPIHRLLRNPALYEPVRAPRNPVVLCHGTCTALDIVAMHLTLCSPQDCTASMCEVRQRSLSSGSTTGLMFWLFYVRRSVLRSWSPVSQGECPLHCAQRRPRLLRRCHLPHN